MSQADPATLRRQGIPIAKALNAIAAATGKTFTMTDEAGRFKIQKAVCLLQRLGYPPAQRFDFNIYLKGPYSPDLTACYYALEDDGIRAAGEAVDIPPATLAILIEALRKSPAFLEGVTTLLDVNLQTRHLPAALARARAIKPHLEETTWKEVRGFLAAHRELTAAT